MPLAIAGLRRPTVLNLPRFVPGLPSYEQGSPGVVNLETGFLDDAMWRRRDIWTTAAGAPYRL